MSMEPDRDPTEFQQFGIVGLLLVAVAWPRSSMRSRSSSHVNPN
jgi:hypothetical protein